MQGLKKEKEAQGVCENDCKGFTEAWWVYTADFHASQKGSDG